MQWTWQGARGLWSTACIKTAVISLLRLLYENGFRCLTEIVVLERFLRLAWTTRKSNQSIQKDFNPEYSLEGTDAKAEAPILWPPDAKTWLTGKKKTLMLGKIEGRRRRGRQRMRCLDGFLKTTDRSLRKLQEIEKNREAWLVAVHGVTKSSVWLSDWTSINQLDIHMSL